MKYKSRIGAAPGVAWPEIAGYIPALCLRQIRMGWRPRRWNSLLLSFERKRLPMTRFLSQVCSLLFVAITFPAWGQNSIPSGNRWLDHLKNDLLPFWTSEAALGKPVGAFPSIRCDDGTLYNDKTPCPEVGARRTPNERYLVALSRQSFGYGVAFHLTGERKYLDMMKAGIDFIRLNAMDRANGGMATTQDLSNGAWGPNPGHRTAQQLAYGLLGIMRHKSRSTKISTNYGHASAPPVS